MWFSSGWSDCSCPHYERRGPDTTPDRRLFQSAREHARACRPERRRRAPQPRQGARPGRADGSDRDPGPAADLGVRHRRVLGEHRQQQPLPPAQRREALQQDCVPLRAHQVGVLLVLGDEPGLPGLVLGIGGLHPRRDRHQAERFPLGRGDQPGRQRPRFPEVAEMLEQPQPDVLRDVLHLAGLQLVVLPDGDDQRGVPVDDLAPRILVAPLGGGHEQRDVRAVVTHAVLPSRALHDPEQPVPETPAGRIPILKLTSQVGNCQGVRRRSGAMSGRPSGLCASSSGCLATGQGGEGGGTDGRAPRVPGKRLRP